MIQALLVTSAIKIAAEFFPTLASKIAGKNAEKVAQQVVDAALTTASLGPDARPEEVIAKLRTDALAQQELRYKLEQLDAEEHERVVRDRESARQYQIAAGPDGRKRANIMVVIVGAGLVVCVGLVFFVKDLDGARLGLITTVAGALLKMFSDAFAFEFGSSRGSKEKDGQIREFSRQLEEVGRENTAAMAKAAVKTAVATQTPPPIVVQTGSGSTNVAEVDIQGEQEPTEAKPFVRNLVEGRISIG